MRRYLFLLTLLLGWSAAAQTPEELYEIYSTPETRAIMERFEEAERRAQEAEAAAHAQKMLILGVAVLIGLVPVVVNGKRIIQEKTWKDNPSGTFRAVMVTLANYGVLYLKLKYGDGFNTTLAFLIVAALIAGSIYLLNKKGDQS